MLDNIPQISEQKVKSIRWNGDPIEYDLELHALGQGRKEFLVLNPNFDTTGLQFRSHGIPFTTNKCIVLKYDGQWVAKIFKRNWTPDQSYLDVDIELDLVIETNPDLPELNYQIDYKIPWFDLRYEHMWMLDSMHTKDLEDEIWAIKVRAMEKTVGVKVIGSVEPIGELEINGDVTVPFELPEDFAVQYYDLGYEHVWLSSEDNERIQVARLYYVDAPKGRKEYDITSLLNDDQLDVVFISYNEPNAENNWNRVKEKAPWAQRVDGVKGILNAHKAAAKVSRTDMFYVVDGDAHLTDTWNFSYRPSIFDRDCTYIWAAVNPLTNLTYGHGGVKLFSKEKLLKLKKWKTLDMTTCVSEKIKVMSEVSNVTEFNTDEFSAWKTAFRECVKLCLNVQTDHANENHQVRLDAWQHIDANLSFSRAAMTGALEGIAFFKEHEFDADALTKINDRDWLEHRFNITYKK